MKELDAIELVLLGRTHPLHRVQISQWRRLRARFGMRLNTDDGMVYEGDHNVLISLLDVSCWGNVRDWNNEVIQ